MKRSGGVVQYVPHSRRSSGTRSVIAVPNPKSASLNRARPESRRARIRRWLAGTGILLFLVIGVAVVARQAVERALLPHLPGSWVESLAASQPDEGWVQLEAGIRARQQCRTSAAVQYLAAATVGLPNSAAAAAQYSQALAESGNFGEARSAFERARSVSADDPQVRIVEARAAVERGDPTAAVTMMDTLLQRRPELGEAWFARGLAYERLHNTRLARESFERAMARGPKWAAFAREAAANREEIGALAEAEDLARQAVRLAPTDASARLLLARVLLDRNLSQDRAREAEQLLQAPLQDAATRPKALLEQGRLQGLLGHWQEAARVLEQASQSAPRDPAPLYELAKAFQHTGDPRAEPTLSKFRALEEEQREERYLRSAIKEDEKGFLPRKHLVEFYAKHGRIPEAQSVLAEYVAFAPSDVRARELARELHLDRVSGQPR